MVDEGPFCKMMLGLEGGGITAFPLFLSPSLPLSPSLSAVQLEDEDREEMEQ